MEMYKDDFKFPPQGSNRLRIIVVGAGIAGLSAALVAPNAARILGRFGVLREVVEKANVLDRNSLRRYANDEELGTAPLMPEIGLTCRLCALNSHAALPSWVENRTVLMGDACHSMLPYVAQGAAQAIEDAGVLACVLSLGGDEVDIPTILKVYERVRKDRAEKFQNGAAETRLALHLPEGEKQRERDEAMKSVDKSPDLLADQEWQAFMCGEDESSLASIL
ncbi:salicylate hydroxylase [Penicillium diatomitis]|uniref:Salicylate hydroxylase n=1 Tax=Penicillium diatomitis TaxID=2819901 RepID=A0A9W9XDU3_9EURO|nr:salicylate hydroxylase [Penicillium diatomitis]KAJ5488917.1 salicylate hydroxylase [Penicillium diatomitis]